MARFRMLPRTSRIVALCSAANFINAADRVIMPIAIVLMTDEFKWNLYWQGWILSAFAFGYFTSQVSKTISVLVVCTRLMPVLTLHSFYSRSSVRVQPAVSAAKRYSCWQFCCGPSVRSSRHCWHNRCRCSYSAESF